MNSSLLREQIEIYEIPIINTEFGTVKEGEPILKYKTRASVQFDSQARVVSEGEIYYPTDRTIIVRHYVPVDNRDRIKWKDKFYNIISINPNKYYNDKEIRVVEYNN